MKPRFLLDENMDHAIRRQLHRLDSSIEILVVGDLDAPPKSTPDPAILIWLEENGYILVTENRRSMPRHLADHFAAGRRIPGVLLIRPAATIGPIIRSLYLIWSAAATEEYQDRMSYIPF